MANVEIVRFVTLDDDKVCQRCASLGGRLFFASMAPKPPLHLRCRCGLQSVYSGPEEDIPPFILEMMQN